jgi:hypothetical protein
LYLLFRAIFQLFPITILPWGFYFIPFVIGKKNQTSQIEDIQFEPESGMTFKEKSVMSVEDKNSILNSKRKSGLNEKLLLSFQEKVVEDDTKTLSLN